MGRWDPGNIVRYPDPAVQVLDPRFTRYRLANAAVERLATGLRWAEGPVWFGDGHYLLCSDIPNDRIVRWTEDGNVWSAAGGGGEGFDGVHVFAPDGTRIGQILLPEKCANICFGGTKRNRLFMAASQSIYALYVEAQGVPGG